MIKNTFLTTLLLQPQDLEKFRSYVSMQSKSKLMNRFLEFLSPLQTPQDIQKTKLFKKLYPHEVYDDIKWRQLLFRLQQLYDAYKMYEVNHRQMTDHLLLAQADAGKNQKKRIRQMVKKSIARQTSIFQYRYKLYVALEEQADIQTKGDRTKEPNYQAINDHFDELFFIEKLKITLGALSYASLNQHLYDYTFIESLEPYMEAHIDESNELLYMLYQTYICHKKNSEDSFFDLMSFLKRTAFEKSEEIDLILRMAGNFSIRKINSGNAQYFEHLFDVYDVTLRNRCMIDDTGHISFNTLLNVLTTALRLKKYQWAEQFLENHVQQLPASERETGSLYLRARLSFEQEQYDQTLQFLSQSEPKDFFQTLLFRVLQLKALYETDETELVDTYLENYRLYLLRHKSNTYHYKLQSTFIQYLKKINKLASAAQRESLLKKLKDEKLIAEKQWLLQQLAV